jgi:integrase/recombinase XerD
MPCHHKLEEYLDAYIRTACISSDRKGPLFRSAIGRTAQPTDRPMLRGDLWSMVRRRASGAGIETAIGCHTFRGTGLYDWRNDDISVGEVERIGI